MDYHSFYSFASGPLVWISFGIFLFGSLGRILLLVRLSLAKDKVLYQDFKANWGLKSIVHWAVPMNITAREEPWVTLAGFVFHLSFLGVALFLSAHGILLEENLNIGWWTLPDFWADILTMVFLASAGFFILRRLFVDRVKVLTTSKDWLVMAITIFPMISGFLAYHQWLDYQSVVLIHVLSGNLFLMAVPFTKLSHMFLFFVSRMITGSDFGKRRVGAW